MTISFFVLSLSLLNLLQFHYIPFSRRGQKQQDCMHLTSAVIYTSTEPPFILFMQKTNSPKEQKIGERKNKDFIAKDARICFVVLFFLRAKIDDTYYL